MLLSSIITGQPISAENGLQTLKNPELSYLELVTLLGSALMDHGPNPVQAITLLILIGKKQTQPIM